MISLLARIFIKNNKDYSNLKVREQYGVLCGGFGIFLNRIKNLFGINSFIFSHYGFWQLPNINFFFD